MMIMTRTDSSLPSQNYLPESTKLSLDCSRPTASQPEEKFCEQGCPLHERGQEQMFILGVDPVTVGTQAVQRRHSHARGNRGIGAAAGPSFRQVNLHGGSDFLGLLEKPDGSLCLRHRGGGGSP